MHALSPLYTPLVSSRTQYNQHSRGPRKSVHSFQTPFSPNLGAAASETTLSTHAQRRPTCTSRQLVDRLAIGMRYDGVLCVILELIKHSIRSTYNLPIEGAALRVVFIGPVNLYCEPGFILLLHTYLYMFYTHRIAILSKGDSVAYQYL